MNDKIIKFDPVLLVMKPRHIPEVIDSIDKNVNIPTMFFQAFPEIEVCKKINEFIQSTSYTHYVISADDIIFHKQPVDEVLKISKHFHDSDRQEVVTGFCKLSRTSSTTNICFKPLEMVDNKKPQLTLDKYYFIEESELNQKINNDTYLFYTYLISFAFSCIPRSYLIKYPMQTYLNGFSSDHNFSSRFFLGEHKGAYTNKTMFFEHLKQDKNKPYKHTFFKNKKWQAIDRFK
jgi:hypothetical protein